MHKLCIKYAKMPVKNALPCSSDWQLGRVVSVGTLQFELWCWCEGETQGLCWGTEL